MLNKGNRKIILRLPLNHWVWTIEDTATRNNEIRLALDFYRHIGCRLEAAIKTIEEIKEKISAEMAPAHERKEEAAKQEKGPEGRLFANMEKFLGF